jgi:hypothetical protein
MEQGFVADATHPHRYSQLAVWYSGAPTRSFWGGLNLRDRTRFYVQTWRCSECGYLESYAL